MKSWRLRWSRDSPRRIRNRRRGSSRATPLLDAEPPIHPDVGRSVTDPAGVPALLDDLQQWQITTVKIYAGTGPDVGRAIIDESHRRGLFVTAHLGRYPAEAPSRTGRWIGAY